MKKLHPRLYKPLFTSLSNFRKSFVYISVAFTAILMYSIPSNAQCSWTDAGISNFSYANFTSIAIDGSGTPYMVYREYGNADKATVRKFNGSSWVTVGTAGFSAGIASYTSIAIDGSGTPYVVYGDYSPTSSGRATVMKYNGSSWVTVGTAGFSAGQAFYTSIAIDGSGTPYVVYQDGGNTNKATVKKYNGSSWVTVGTAGFSLGAAGYTSIAIDGSGTPYVVYSDGGFSGRAVVRKYNGSSWVGVGTNALSGSLASYTSIAIDGSGTLYVVYMDGVNGNKATVKKLNGSIWETVGVASFSPAAAYYTSIAIDGSGTPYVVYKDGGNANKATVMKYDGSSWATVGTAGFSAGEANYTSIAIDAAGTVYTIYTSSASPATGHASSKTWGIPATTATTQTTTINAPFTGLFINNCNIIARVKPAGVSPISGSTDAKVWIESTQSTGVNYTFVKRHYEITPATGASTATGKVTLYFTQQEFTDFNAASTGDLNLPTSSADATGIANLRIEKRPGISSNGTGLPSTYTGTAVTIDPADADIVWNATASRWEVSFEVTGFSGFFVKTQVTVLPVTLLNFSGSKQAAGNVLQWQTASEINTNRYEIESSSNANSFTKMASVNAVGSGSNAYSYTDVTKYSSKVYYRLKMIDNDGKFTYSNIIFIHNDGKDAITVYPNPTRDFVNINISSTALLNSTARLIDASGRVIKTIKLTTQNVQIDIKNVNTGVFILKLDNGSSFKIIKE
jgi:Secretion system C-terminal sorting domain